MPTWAVVVIFCLAVIFLVWLAMKVDPEILEAFFDTLTDWDD